jgi:hypothetical protein
MDCINGLGTYVRKAAGSIRRIGVLRMPIVLLITFAVILTVGSAFGQGFLMTQLVVPGAQTQSTYPQGVNVNGAVVGYYTNSSGIRASYIRRGLTPRLVIRALPDTPVLGASTTRAPWLVTMR